MDEQTMIITGLEKLTVSQQIFMRLIHTLFNDVKLLMCRQNPLLHGFSCTLIVAVQEQARLTSL